MRALCTYSGNLQTYIIPSEEVVIRCFRLDEKDIAVVTSPQENLVTKLPVAAS